jgi:hypothetical protein
MADTRNPPVAAPQRLAAVGLWWTTNKARSTSPGVVAWQCRVVAMTALATERFTMADIRAGKNLRGFAQAMMRHAKAAEMTSIYNQLLAVWNGLDVPIQTQISMPQLYYLLC